MATKDTGGGQQKATRTPRRSRSRRRTRRLRGPQGAPGEAERRRRLRTGRDRRRPRGERRGLRALLRSKGRRVALSIPKGSEVYGLTDAAESARAPARVGACDASTSACRGTGPCDGVPEQRCRAGEAASVTTASDGCRPCKPAGESDVRSSGSTDHDAEVTEIGICRSAAAPRMWITATRRVGSVAYCASTAIRPSELGTIPTRRAAAYVEGIAWKPTLVAPGVYQLPS